MSGARRAAAPSRYLWAKFRAAAEETFFHLTAPTRQEAATISGKATGASSPTLASALATFSQAYSRNLTTVMLIAGNAMYPNLNRNYEKDKGAVEKLVVRLLPRASAATVFVGDVLAFHSPLAASSTAAAGSGGGASVMVRRVVAMEEGEMVVEGDASEATVAVIPKGHFWALADNPELKPPHVIDSRTYGHVPLSNVIGRVVYQAASVSEHGPVLNSSEAAAADQPVIEGEVDVEELFAAGGGGDDNDDDQQDYEEEEEQEKHDEGDQRQQGAGDKAAAEGAGKAPDGRGTTGQPPPAGGPGKSS